MILCCPYACCNSGPVRTVQQGFIGLKTSFGKYVDKVGPGLYTFNPYRPRATITTGNKYYT